jgi:hypothetical protein
MTLTLTNNPLSLIFGYLDLNEVMKGSGSVSKLWRSSVLKLLLVLNVRIFNLLTGKIDPLWKKWGRFKPLKDTEKEIFQSEAFPGISESSVKTDTVFVSTISFFDPEITERQKKEALSIFANCYNYGLGRGQNDKKCKRISSAC